VKLAEMVAEIARRCPGGELPKNYVVLDLETSGLDPHTNVGLQYGLLFVKDNTTIDCVTTLLRYPESVPISPDATAVHGFDHARLAKEGIPPEEAIPAIVKMLKDATANGWMFLGHNISAFDRWIIERDARQYGEAFIFGPNSIIDTGMLVKASQLDNIPFNQDDTLEAFYDRIRDIRVRIKWSLSGYCYDRFKLGRYGVGKDEAHDAGVDCKLVHYLYREFVQMLKDSGHDCGNR
jgi:DNA polymerase III epsilon subunit-like protein